MEGPDYLGMRDFRRRKPRPAPSTIASPCPGAPLKSVRAVAKKLARLAGDPTAPLRVLDLFAGCGGLSLGFKAAGCEIVAAVEIDELAARSHAMNFFKG